MDGSAQGEYGKTDIVLQNLLIGMQNAGSFVEMVYLNKLDIKFCTGCFGCWFKTPGQCIYNDDTQKVLLKLVKADLVIYAMPMYVYSMSGLMKNFFDRTLSLVSPYVKNDKVYKMFLVATAGFYGLERFKPLVSTFKHIAEMDNLRSIKYLGEILMPATGVFDRYDMQDRIAAYKEDLQLAGKQLVEHESINKDLLEKLHQPWLTAEEYMKTIKEAFQMERNKYK